MDLYTPDPPGVASSGRRPLPPVLLLHGFRGYKDWGFLPFLARKLAQEGFPAIAISASGSGVAGGDGSYSEPERFRRNTYGRELVDLGRVADWAAQGAPRPRLGLVGHSRGGGIALLQAARDHRVACVVTLAAMSRLGIWEADRIARWERREDAPIYDFRTRGSLAMSPDLWDDFRRNVASYDLSRAIESLCSPLLVVHGDKDRVVPLEHAREIASHGSATMTELLVVKGAGHTFQAGDTIRRVPPQLLNMAEATVAWMRRWLPWNG